jgi:hypothetical protein
MKRKIALLLAWIAVAAPALAAEEPESRRKDSETYESPVLSLLLLPVNVLIKIASMFGPGETDKASRDSRPAGSSSKASASPED